MRRSSKFNFYLETICGYILVLIMLASGVTFFYGALTTSLDKSATFSGIIQEIGVIKSRPSVSRFGTTQRNILGLKMHGLDGVYSIYNPQQNYTSYLDILHVGDSITIHYNYKPGPYGTALYQITKGKETILRLKQYTYRQLFVGVLALVGGLLIGWRITLKVSTRMKKIDHSIL